MDSFAFLSAVEEFALAHVQRRFKAYAERACFEKKAVAIEGFLDVCLATCWLHVAGIAGCSLLCVRSVVLGARRESIGNVIGAKERGRRASNIEGL